MSVRSKKANYPSTSAQIGFDSVPAAIRPLTLETHRSGAASCALKSSGKSKYSRVPQEAD